MSQDRDHVREAFQKPESIWVQVTPEGFLLGAKAELASRLEGRLTAVSLVRKLFEEGKLVCDSQDGIQARNGVLCHHCLHPLCRPQLRIELCRWAVTYRLDLAKTSAQNFFALEDEAAASGEELLDVTLRLSVINQGRWGEVCFDRVDRSRHSRS